jgi:lipoprotein-anchoring transpeptidase ErfK/SrfK
MFRGLLVVVGMGLAIICLPLAVIATPSGEDTVSTAPSSVRVKGPTRFGERNIQLVRNISHRTDKAATGKKRQARHRLQDQTSPERNVAIPSGPATTSSPQARTLPQNESQPDSPGVGPAAYSPQARTSPGEQPGGPVDGLKFAPGQSRSSDAPLGYVEIEVSHSQHTFKLLEHHPDGATEVLHECRVGLGGPGFPTPVGMYYVTHIYDDNPWWIPPKDRAWAAGDSPSKRVYGGTMAPLLKKRPVRMKKHALAPELEDMIEGPVQLDDYGYRFHGTNQPRSIGRNQSHGCVRMLPADAKKVAALIKEHVGEEREGQSENGTFKILKAPVRLNLVK